MAHDRRIGNERWYWLAGLRDEVLDRDFDVSQAADGVSLAARSVPALQRVGDFVVYVGTTTGALLGIGEVVDRPYRKSDELASWRVRTEPRLIVDRDRAPSIADAGMEKPTLARHLEPSEYERLERLMGPVAVAR